MSITPLGSLNPPSRPLPGDHIYFAFTTGIPSPAAARTSFFAPADGIVADVLVHSAQLPDVKVTVRVTTFVTYYIDHLIPDIPLARGARVTAGQRLGTTGSSLEVDLGVVNEGLTLTFANPARYPNLGMLHTDAPLKYFDEPLRSQLYAKVQRIGPDLDGKIDYDIPGRLSGNWFGTDAIPLVFVYDSYDPGKVVIAVSGGLLRTGLFTIAAGDPSPRDVSVASGAVRYTLAVRGGPGSAPGVPTARLLVQMLDDQRIRVEMFELAASADAFTGSAAVFMR